VLTEDRVLEILFTDKDGNGLPVRDVVGHLTHPANAQADTELVLLNPAPGRYTVRLEPERMGNWTLRISATGPDARPIEQRRKLWLK